MRDDRFRLGPLHNAAGLVAANGRQARVEPEYRLTWLRRFPALITDAPEREVAAALHVLRLRFTNAVRLPTGETAYVVRAL